MEVFPLTYLVDLERVGGSIGGLSSQEVSITRSRRGVGCNVLRFVLVDESVAVDSRCLAPCVLCAAGTRVGISEVAAAAAVDDVRVQTWAWGDRTRVVHVLYGWEACVRIDYLFRPGFGVLFANFLDGLEAVFVHGRGVEHE